MQLEVLSKDGFYAQQNPPIVLVHGAWHGAWCWRDNFLDYFAEQGWPVYAISLRGHGNSDGREQLRWASISDYVEDLARFVESLDQAPIIIGHSMGGFVLQKFLESHKAAAGVLLASVPPAGTLRFNLRVLKRHPLKWLKANLTGSLYCLVGTPELAREWFFSERVTQSAVEHHFPQVQDESYRASLDLLFLSRLKPEWVKTPICVVGGELDAIFSVAEVNKTAAAYGVEAKIFSGMAHNLMAEPEWQRVADHILAFAETVSETHQ